jgi:hypothetical protein
LIDRRRERHDLVEAEVGEPIVERETRSLGGIPGAPDVTAETPANSDRSSADGKYSMTTGSAFMATKITRSAGVERRRSIRADRSRPAQ